jgi:hypothetical protein
MNSGEPMGGYQDGLNQYASWFSVNRMDPLGLEAINLKFAAFIHGDRGKWLFEPFSVVAQFKTDERGFGESGTSRIESKSDFDSCSIGSDPTGTNIPGASHRRTRKRESRRVWGPWGEPEEKTTTLSTDEVTPSSEECKSTIEFSAAGNYPFVSSSPDIDYIATFTIEAIEPDKVKVTVEGKHDGFPDYEAVVNGQVIYSRKSPSSGPGLWNLGGGPEISFSESVILDLKTPECCEGTCE